MRSFERVPPKHRARVSPQDPVDHVERRVAETRPRVDGNEPAGACAIEHVGGVQIAMQEHLGAPIRSEGARALAPSFKVRHRHEPGGIGVGAAPADPELEEEVDPRRESRDLARGTGCTDVMQRGDERGDLARLHLAERFRNRYRARDLLHEDGADRSVVAPHQRGATRRLELRNASASSRASSGSGVSLRIAPRPSVRRQRTTSEVFPRPTASSRSTSHRSVSSASTAGSRSHHLSTDAPKRARSRPRVRINSGEARSTPATMSSGSNEQQSVPRPVATTRGAPGPTRRLIAVPTCPR